MAVKLAQLASEDDGGFLGRCEWAFKVHARVIMEDQGTYSANEIDTAKKILKDQIPVSELRDLIIGHPDAQENDKPFQTNDAKMKSSAVGSYGVLVDINI